MQPKQILLVNFEELVLEKAGILTSDESGMEGVGKKTLRYLPVWQWLLTD